MNNATTMPNQHP